MLKYQVIFKFFLILVIAPAVIGFAVWSLDKNGFFEIQTVDIQVNTQSDQKNYIKTYANDLSHKLEGFKGQSLWQVELSEVKALLQKEKWLKEFRVYRSWPSTLSVEMTAQEIAFLYSDSKQMAQGVLRPLNMDGEFLPAVDTRQAPSKAFLKGEIFLKDENKRKKAIELLRSMPSEGKMAFDQLSEVNYDPKVGFWISMIQSDTKVQLGDGQFSMKTARVSQVLDYLEKKNLKARVIDANLSKKVLVRLQQNP